MGGATRHIPLLSQHLYPQAKESLSELIIVHVIVSNNFSCAILLNTTNSAPKYILL